MDFENFKSNICHSLKKKGDLLFLKDILESNDIHEYFKNEKLLECFYLLGMADYLCRKNDLPCSNSYNYIRKYKLENLVFPADINLLCIMFKNDEPKEEILKVAIPEFLQYNIVENEVYSAY